MLNIRKHRLVLVQILKDIYSDSQLGPLLGFKGGTAAYLFYGLPRFSVDLDLDLLDTEKKDFVFQKIKNILEKYGKIKETREKRFTLFFLLSYEEGLQNVKIEISKRTFPNQYEIRDYLGISMLVMQKSYMFAHKLVALTERKQLANRDLFDIYYFFSQHWEIDEKIIKLRTGCSLKEYLRKCLSFIEKVNNKQILQGLGDLIDEKQKALVKNKLKQELIFLIRYYLS